MKSLEKFFDITHKLFVDDRIDFDTAKELNAAACELAIERWNEGREEYKALLKTHTWKEKR